MIARLFALLAVLTIALSPLNAAAAARACEHMDQAAAVEAQDGAAMADMPCCDPDQSGPMDPACAAACIVMAGVTADLPFPPEVLRPGADRAAFPLARVRSFDGHPPPPLERPPRAHA